MGNKCNDRGERRWLNYRKFWKRVKKYAKWYPEILKPENWHIRHWVADQHNCPCPMCREKSKKYHGNSKEKYSVQELKMMDTEDEITNEVFRPDNLEDK